MARKANQHDLWNGKITITWVRKPGDYDPKETIKGWVLDEACQILNRLIGGKFSAIVETDSKEVLDTD